MFKSTPKTTADIEEEKTSQERETGSREQKAPLDNDTHAGQETPDIAMQARSILSIDPSKLESRLIVRLATSAFHRS